MSEIRMAEGKEDWQAFSHCPSEIFEVMEKRKERIEALRQEITDIERDNEGWKNHFRISILATRRLSYPELARASCTSSPIA